LVAKIYHNDSDDEIGQYVLYLRYTKVEIGYM